MSQNNRVKMKIRTVFVCCCLVMVSCEKSVDGAKDNPSQKKDETDISALETFRRLQEISYGWADRLFCVSIL